MKIRKIVVLLIVIVCCSMSFGVAEQAENQKSQLKFTISDEPKDCNASRNQAMQIAKPTHVAVFSVNTYSFRYWESKHMRVETLSKYKDRTRRLVRVTFDEDVRSSQAQKFLVTTVKVGNSIVQLQLYGKSEKDTREKVQSMIAKYNNIAVNIVSKAEADLKNHRRNISNIEKTISKLQVDRAAHEENLLARKKATYYRTPDDAQRAILEWSNLLNVANVDIASINGKLDKINQLQKEERKKNAMATDLLVSLIRMKMGEEVELAGALARKSAIQLRCTETLDFLGVVEKLHVIINELDAAKRKLSQDQRKLEDIKTKLPQLRADVKPLEVRGNKVAIFPLK